VSKKVVHDGFMTYEGYMGYVAKGDDNPEYETFARGVFPGSSSPDCLIPLNWLDDFTGTFIFEPGTVVVCAGVDLALDGDDCIFFVGRYGKSNKWIPAASNKIIQMEESDGESRKPQYVLQLDAWVTLAQKSRSGARYEEIQELVKKFGVSYEFLSLDSTGIGRGVVDNFIEKGYKVRAISWGSGATHKKILEEDTMHADERFSDITSEMYHAARAWIEGGFIKASPYLDIDRLRRELTGRRRKPSGRIGETGEPLMAIEKKIEFKSRYGGKSPDVSDGMVMMLHGCRMGGEELARIVRRKTVHLQQPINDENLSYIDFST
jgi:hypothetical protein